MPSEEPRPDRCGAECRSGGYCESYPVDGSERCRMHGGATPTKEENENVGNGDQQYNGNAVRHNQSADRGKLYHRLSDERQAQVDEYEAALIDRYQEYHGRDPDPADVKDCFEIAMGYVVRDFGRDYMAESAEESGNPLLQHVEIEEKGVEFDKPNDVLESVTDSRREDRLARKDKGLEKDPESQQASAQQDMADRWKAGLETDQ